MTFQIATGDLLEQRVDAIVNTVNTVGIMGKGIALQFKRKWPANAKAYEAACKHGEVVPGKMWLFAPTMSEGVRELVPEEAKPKMTAGRAAIIKVMSVYREMRYALSQIEVQKLTYFLVRGGQDLSGLEFEKHTYGPYAQALRHVLIKMDGAYLQGVGDGTRPSEIKIIPSALEDAEQFLASHEDDATTRRVQKVGRLIEGFETPYGMELLATVHWDSTEAPTATSIDEIVSRVHGWNARKRKIMTAAHIKIAYERLVTEGWCQPVSVNALDLRA